jgi:hypothetical protein
MTTLNAEKLNVLRWVVSRSAVCGGTLLLSFLVLCMALPVVAYSATKLVHPRVRCGWFDNPSAGNASLFDRSGEWVIASQGQHQAEGLWPQFKVSRWVRTGVGSYGYGCACMYVLTDINQRTITRIQSSVVKPLSACRKDRALKEPENPMLSQ